MSVSMDIYSKCDGIPRVSDTLTITSDNQRSTIIAAVSGKRIVPIWCFIWTTGNNIHYVTVGSNLSQTGVANQEVIIPEAAFANNLVNEPFFANFGMNHFTTIPISTALEVRTYGAAGSTDRVKVGYYLIDG